MTNFDDKIAEHLEVCPDWGPPEPLNTFLALALAGEAGELANLYKKEWRDGQADERQIKILKELGDVQAYTLMLAHSLGVDIIALAKRSFLEFEQRPEYEQLLASMRTYRKELKP